MANWSNPYTATQLLLPSLKRRGMLPTSTETLTDSDFLALANEEMQLMLSRLLHGLREEYFVTSSTFTPAASVAIPQRALGGKLREVQISNGNGYTSIPRIEPGDASEYVDSAAGTAAYYLQDGSVFFSPGTPNGTIRLKYFYRPGRLVDETTTRRITAITTATNTITTESTVPAAFVVTTASAIPTYYDFIHGEPGFECLGIGHTASSSSGTTMIFSDLPDGLAVGDYVALYGESPIPQIPVELHSLLAERVVLRALEALGDQRSEALRKSVLEMEQAAVSLLQPRVEDSKRYIINRSGPGFSRRRFYTR